MSSTSKPRRTQEERSNATREAVIKATIQSLIEDGYAATSTTAIQVRAGVSRGALTHQFPTKVDLMISAIRYLLEARVEAMRKQAVHAPTGGDRVEAALRVVWSETFENGDLFAAAMELWAAARTDDELHRSLLSVEREMASLLLRECSEVFGEEIAIRPTFDRAFRAALLYLRGAALSNIVRPKGSSTAWYLAEATTLFRCLLDHADAYSDMPALDAVSRRRRRAHAR